MPGEVKRLIDKIINQRSKGNPTLVSTIETKLILKGVDVDRYTLASPDDPEQIAKVREVASEMGVIV